MNVIRFGRILPVLFSFCLAIARAPAQPPPEAANYPQPAVHSPGVIGVSSFYKFEIQYVSGKTVGLNLEFDLRSERNVDITRITFEDLRIEGVPILPFRGAGENFRIEKNKAFRKVVTVEALTNADMYSWFKEDLLGRGVRSEGTLYFSGIEPKSGLLGSDKPLGDQSASLNNLRPLLVASDAVKSDLKKAICREYSNVCTIDNPPPASAPTVTWEQKMKELVQGRLVILQATYYADAITDGVSVFRQGFRLPSGEILAPTDLLDAAKAAGAPSGDLSADIQAKVRDFFDLFQRTISNKPAATAATAQPTSHEAHIVAWVPTPPGADHITLGLGTSYPVRLRKRLAIQDAGGIRSELGIFEFQDAWPPVNSGEISWLGPYLAPGECINVRLDSVPGVSLTNSTQDARAIFSKVGSTRPMGGVVGLDGPFHPEWYGSAVINRDGKFVGIINGDRTAVLASELRRAMDAPAAPDPVPPTTRVDADAGTLELTVLSVPPSANVYVAGKLNFASDGKPDTTPTKIRLARGVHRITVEKQGYAPITRDIEMKDEDLTWKVTLRK